MGLFLLPYGRSPLNVSDRGLLGRRLVIATRIRERTMSGTTIPWPLNNPECVAATVDDTRWSDGCGSFNSLLNNVGMSAQFHFKKRLERVHRTNIARNEGEEL